MEFNRHQKLDMIEALVLHNGGEYRKLPNEIDAYRMPNRSWVKLVSPDPFAVEADTKARYEDVPSSKAPLGGVARVKDWRRALEIIDTSRANITVDMPNEYQMACHIANALTDSNMQFSGHESLSDTVKSCLNRAFGSELILSRFALHGAEFYWEEHHSRSLGREPDMAYYDTTGLVPTLQDKEIMQNAVKHLLDYNDESADLFILNFHRFCCSKNLAVRIHSHSGSPESLDHDVETKLRDGYAVYQKNNDAVAYVNSICELTYERRPLGASIKRPRMTGVDMLRQVMRTPSPPKEIANTAPDVLDDTTKRKLELVQKMNARTELWQWQGVVNSLLDRKDIRVDHKQIQEAYEQIMPAVIPPLVNIDLDEVRAALTNASEKFGGMLTAISNKTLDKAFLAANTFFDKEDKGYSAIASVIDQIKSSFDSASLVEKYTISLGAKDYFSPENISGIKMEISKGVPEDKIVNLSLVEYESVKKAAAPDMSTLKFDKPVSPSIKMA